MSSDYSQTDMISRHLLRLQQGETSALDDLLKYASERLEHLTRKMLSSFAQVHAYEQTGDVMQNALIRLTRALQETEVTDPRHFFRLAALQIRRELIDLSRRYNGRRDVSLDGSKSTDQSDASFGVEVAGQTYDPRRIAEWTHFHEEIAALPEKEREVVDLLLYNGLSQAEAAVVMGVDVRSIKRYWQRARLSLYQRLSGGTTSPTNLLMS